MLDKRAIIRARRHRKVFTTGRTGRTHRTWTRAVCHLVVVGEIHFFFFFLLAISAADSPVGGAKSKFMVTAKTGYQ